jgi:hypothetical protein
MSFTEFPSSFNSCACSLLHALCPRSSGPEYLLVFYLANAGLPVIVINPRKVRDSCAAGQLADDLRGTLSGM